MKQGTTLVQSFIRSGYEDQTHYDGASDFSPNNSSFSFLGGVVFRFISGLSRFLMSDTYLRLLPSVRVRRRKSDLSQGEKRSDK